LHQEVLEVLKKVVVGSGQASVERTRVSLGEYDSGVESIGASGFRAITWAVHKTSTGSGWIVGVERE
jgi:hypothetical protein